MNITNIHSAIQKYIRKYYLFKILRGFLISFSILSFVFLLIVLIHFFNYFTVPLKKFIFWFFILFSLFVVSEFILLPLFKMLNILPALTKYDAAKNISSFFNQIDDKLINILELNDLPQNNTLILASISQKIEQIKFFDFKKAVNFSEIKPILKYLILPSILFLFIVFYNISILTVGTKKFADYNVYYEPQAPFTFNLLNKSLNVQQGSDLQINLKISGDILPENVNIIYGSNTLPMIKDIKDLSSFKYNFKSLNNSFTFYFEANGYKSAIYSVKVLPSPGITNFIIKAEPPAYTGKQPFQLQNSGDILVPFGTHLTFNITTFSTDSLCFRYDSVCNFAQRQSDDFTFDLIALKSIKYKIFAANKYIKLPLFNYTLTVTPDLFPDIQVDAIQDSTKLTKFYYHGYINDDYGFSKLRFNYCVTEKAKNIPDKSQFKHISIPFNRTVLTQEFYYLFDFSDILDNTKQIVYYYFSVSDNDAITGGKTVKTPIFNFYYPTEAELDSLITDIDSNVSEKLQDAQQLATEIQLDIQAFNEKMLNENVSEWEKQSFLDNLLNKQDMLNSMIDSLKQQNNKKIENLENFKKQNDELLQKQKAIQELLDQLLTDDMKKMLEEMKKLQEEFNQKQFDKMMKNAEFDYKQLNQELDRSHELLKRMTIEQKVQNTIDKLNELSKNQENLSKDLKNSKDISPQIQDSLLTDEFEFKKLRAEYDSLLKQNSDLEKPFDLDSMQQQFDQIQQDFEDTKQQMFDNKKNKSSKSMQKTSDDMQQMSQMMSSMMQQNMQSQNAEDIQTIKFLLSNILSFSFDQELLYNKTLKKPSSFSSAYKQLSIRQLDLSKDFNVVRDSLNALAKRNPMIGRIITQEVVSIENNLKIVNQNFTQANLKNTAVKQRNIIMSANKLALMLQESLQSMQNSQSMAGSGSPQQSNSKPQPGVGDLKQLQDAMSKQLQQMMQQMKSGQMPNSQQLATQLGMREQLQKMLQDMINSDQTSDELRNLLEEIKKMNDDVKDDVLNNNLTPETLLRDKKITTKLLDSEKAENKRKYSDKRKSNTSEDIMHTVPDNIEQYFKNSKSINEIFNKNNLFLNPFYKQYYNEYVIRLGH